MPWFKINPVFWVHSDPQSVILQNSNSEWSLAVLALCSHWWVVLAVEWAWHHELQFISVIWAKKLLKRNSVSSCGTCSGCIGRSIPLPPSLSHYIIARFSGSVKNLVQAKLLNSYSGHSTICEQSGRALSGHTVCFGVTGKLLLLWKKSFLRAWVVAPKSKTSLQKS